MLKLTVKLNAIPELDRPLTDDQQDAISRAAADGVALTLREHFLTLPGKRFWGEASEKVRVTPGEKNSYRIGVFQRGVHLQYKGGTVKPTGRPSEVTGKPTKSLFIPRADGPIREGRCSLHEFLAGRSGRVRVIKRKGSGKVFLVMDMEERIAIPYMTKTGKKRNRYKTATPLRILGSLVKRANIPAHPEVLPTNEELLAGAREDAEFKLNEIINKQKHHA